MKVKKEFYALMGTKEIILFETEKDAIEEWKKLSNPNNILWEIDLRQKQMKEFEWKKLALSLLK